MIWMKYIVSDDINNITDKFNPNTSNTINVGKLFI